MKLITTTVLTSTLIFTGAVQTVSAANALDTVKDALARLMPKASPDSVMESAI